MSVIWSLLEAGERETCGFKNGVKCMFTEMSIKAITGYCLETQIKTLASGKALPCSVRLCAFVFTKDKYNYVL